MVAIQWTFIFVCVGISTPIGLLKQSSRKHTDDIEANRSRWWLLTFGSGIYRWIWKQLALLGKKHKTRVTLLSWLLLSNSVAEQSPRWKLSVKFVGENQKEIKKKK